MLPPAMRPGGSISPMIEKPVTDLPDPDSPTSPSTSPRARSNDTSATAGSTPSRVANSVRRLRTWSSGARHLASLGFSTSRSWSPTRLIARIVSSSAMPGYTLIQYLPDIRYS